MIVIILIIYKNYNESFRIETKNKQYKIINYVQKNVKPIKNTKDILDLSPAQYTEKISDYDSLINHQGFQPNYILNHPTDLTTSFEITDSIPANINESTALPSDSLPQEKSYLSENFMNDPNMNFQISQNDGGNVINISGQKLENMSYVQNINNKLYQNTQSVLPFNQSMQYFDSQQSIII